LHYFKIQTIQNPTEYETKWVYSISYVVVRLAMFCQQNLSRDVT